MSWGLLPFIILDVVAGIAAGLLISYYILRRQNKSFPLFQIFQKKSLKTESGESAEPPAPPPHIAEDPPPQATESPAVLDQAGLIQELENNLEIASRPMGEKLGKFQTEVWDAGQSWFNKNKPPFLNELSDAYLDMQLANNVVWLVTELGHESPDFRASYSEVKNRVALRLKRVLPKVKSP
jgi:hypothetical protein